METERTIKTIVENLFRLQNVPMNETLFGLNLREQKDFHKLADKLKTHFGSHVEVHSNDTIYSLSTKIVRAVTL